MDWPPDDFTPRDPSLDPALYDETYDVVDETEVVSPSNGTKQSPSDAELDDTLVAKPPTPGRRRAQGAPMPRHPIQPAAMPYRPRAPSASRGSVRRRPSPDQTERDAEVSERRLIVHCVDCGGNAPGHFKHHPSAFYFDQPRLFEGDSGGSALRGQRPMRSREEYLRSRPGVGMVVWRYYDCRKYHSQLRSAFEHLPLPNADPGVPTDLFPYFDILRTTGEPAEAVDEAIEVLPPCRAAMEELAAAEPSLLAGWESNLVSPYLLFYHLRPRLGHLAQSVLSPDSAVYPLLLLDYVNEACGDEYREADDLFSRGLVTRDHLTKLFGPNEVVVNVAGEEPVALISELCPSPSIGSVPIRCYNWAFDGLFHKQETVLKLKWGDADGGHSGSIGISRGNVGEDAREITSLDTFPLRFEKTGQLKHALKDRGAMFWACRKAKFIEYHAPTPMYDVQMSAPRYMIDMTMYQQFHKKDAAKPQKRRDDLGKRLMSLDEPPKGPFLLLLPPRIQGFGMYDKKWRSLLVRYIRPVNFNNRAFDQLVLDGQKKELIEAMVRIHVSTKMTTDIVEGKGNGLILLLHGGPGTGKTLTAESVAELAEKPLYRVTCGDIGTDAERVEKYLESVLYIGTTWKAVVLLDESDVFLEEREKTDLQRNALVSVFLRVLEYYEGILVLTSNRVGIFDEAFKSRVQLALHYPPLDVDGRRHIWNNFFSFLEQLEQSATSTATESDRGNNGGNGTSRPFGGGIMDGRLSRAERVNVNELRLKLDLLAKEKLNGRQIRNAITTARQLALFRGRPLGYAHLEQTIKAANDFERYIQKTHGHDAGEYARASGTRLE